MMKVVVTGGTGFIGCNLIPFLKRKGYFVRCVGRNIKKRSKSRGNMFGQADEILQLDLSSPDNAQVAVSGMEYVVHLACDMAGVGFFNTHDYYPFLNNMQMDMNILNACEKSKTFKRLFYPSSACIYPTHLQMVEGNAPMLSENIIYPANCDLSYGWEKLMALRLCERAPFDARVGILGTVFGPYQETEGERTKAPTAIATKAIKSLKTGTLEIWGDGKQIRSFLYIDEAIQKIYKVLTSQRYEGPVNIASDEAVTITQVAKICCELVGSKPKFVYNTAKPSGTLSRNSDNTKFNKIYKTKNSISTREGFKKLIDFMLQDPSRLR